MLGEVVYLYPILVILKDRVVIFLDTIEDN